MNVIASWGVTAGKHEGVLGRIGYWFGWYLRSAQKHDQERETTGRREGVVGETP